MENKEFLEILKTAKAMNWEPELAHYLDNKIVDLYHEMDPEETWLDRLIEATDNDYPADDYGNPYICLGALLGYENCLCLVKDKKDNCLECWKTPVKEIDTLKE